MALLGFKQTLVAHQAAVSFTKEVLERFEERKEAYRKASNEEELDRVPSPSGLEYEVVPIEGRVYDLFSVSIQFSESKLPKGSGANPPRGVEEGAIRRWLTVFKEEDGKGVVCRAEDKDVLQTARELGDFIFEFTVKKG